jgi:hypothetical protein
VDYALHAFDYPNEASLFPYKVCHPKVKKRAFIAFIKIDTYQVLSTATQTGYSH